MVTAELNAEGLVQLDGDLEGRQIPGVKHDGTAWVMPLSWAACVILREVLGADLEVGPQLAAWAQEERARVDAAIAAKLGDGVEFTPEAESDVAREYEDVAVRVIVPEEQWWWDVWQGMPEFLNRDISPWKSIKVHFRSRTDMERFAKLVGVDIRPKTPAMWFPEAATVHEQEWRWTDEGEEPPDNYGTTSARNEKREAKAAAGKPAAKRGKKNANRAAQAEEGLSDEGLAALLGAMNS